MERDSRRTPASPSTRSRSAPRPGPSLHRPASSTSGAEAGGRIIVPPDPATLKAIAETTGGKFSEARSSKSLQAAYAGLGSRLGRKPGKSEVTFLFVGAAALLLLAAAVASAVTSPRLP